MRTLQKYIDLLSFINYIYEPFGKYLKFIKDQKGGQRTRIERELTNKSIYSFFVFGYSSYFWKIINQDVCNIASNRNDLDLEIFFWSLLSK